LSEHIEQSEERERRLARVNELREAGRDPFLIERYERTHTAQEVTADSASHWTLPEEESKTLSYRLAGRVTSQRSKGKTAFYDLRDGSGRIQLYIRKDDLGDEAFEDCLALDLGDIIGVEGFPFKTRTGEPSIHVKTVTLLSKPLRAVPFGKIDPDGKVHSGLSNVEDRYRYRYLDLLVNPEAKAILTKRCQIVSAMRRFLDGEDFLEVETPTLQEVAGGAAARPFMTHHNALKHDFKLRISLELPLKRLIVGGYEKVYEIGRVYRNEGIDTQHNPEFTLMELYQAYANLEDVMDLVERMYASIAESVLGSSVITVQGETVDFAQRPWTRLPMLEGIQNNAGISPEEMTSLETAKAACERIKVAFPLEKENTLGGLIEKLHEVYTQPKLIQPTFITDFPIETSPLAKKRQDNPALTRRFEVYIGGAELGNAFSEINDPIDQRERFEGQLQQRADGDDEAHPMDEDFIRALEYGMPPTGGLGIGIDRMVMVLTGAESIRDVILFPLLRPGH